MCYNFDYKRRGKKYTKIESYHKRMNKRNSYDILASQKPSSIEMEVESILTQLTKAFVMPNVNFFSVTAHISCLFINCSKRFSLHFNTKNLTVLSFTVSSFMRVFFKCFV